MLTMLTDLLLRATVRRWLAADDVPGARRKLDRLQGTMDPMSRRTPVAAAGPGLWWIGEGGGPATVHLHGGGFLFGGRASHGAFCARLAAATGGPVLLVDYRLAPEHPCPAAREDALAAWRQVADRPGPLWLAGDSAGGGLALSVVQQLAEEGARLPDRLLLISPWLDLTLSAPSLESNAARDAMLSMETLRRMRDHYLQGAAADQASPLSGRMAGLPPIRCVCSESEMLRDDSRRLAERVRAGGGEVGLREFAGQPHVFPLFKLLPASREAVRFLVA